MTSFAKRLVALAAMATVVSATVGAASAHAFVPRQPSDFFGVSSPNLFGKRAQGVLLDSYFTHIQATGAAWVRDAVPWPDAEQVPPVAGIHTYTWDPFDTQVARLARHELALQPVIRQTPLWAQDPAVQQDEDCRTRQNGRNGKPSALGANAYGAFVGDYMARYGREGSFWDEHPELPEHPVTRIELWNEPNWSPFFCPGPDPKRYAAMVSAAADAAHAVDPAAVVSVGGLVAVKADSYDSNGTLKRAEVGKFLQRMTAAVPTLPEKVDAVAIHLYDLDPDVDISLIGWLRAKMQAAGLGDASILVTEYGWHTDGGPGSIPEDLRAQYERIFANQAPRLNCGVIGIAPHAWVTDEENAKNPGSQEAWWGIADPATGEPYPTGQAYADQVALYEGNGDVAAPRRTIRVCDAPLPDQDGDRTPDQSDDYPLDGDRWEGSGEVPSDPPPPRPPSRPPRVAKDFFGAMSGPWADDVRRRRAKPDSMDTGRIGQSREVVSWRQIAPRASSDLNSDARWSELDARFLRLGLRGVRVIPTFADPPAWANPSSPAAAEKSFATFLTGFAKRYGRGGIFWQRNRHLDASRLAVRDYEIWDRGNLSQSWWDGSPSPSEYASAYAQARKALRGVDPHARALVSLDRGGTSYASFVRGMVAAHPELAGDVDGAFVLAGGARTSFGVHGVVAAVRSELEGTGNSATPIYVGFGWYTSGPGAMSETDRALFYGRVASELARSDCGVGGLLARAWVTPQNASNPSAWYGMVDPQTFGLSETAQAYRGTAQTYLGYRDRAPRAVIHACMRPPPDHDGDGVPDAAEAYPLDPRRAVALASPPPAPSLGAAPAHWSNSLAARFTYSARGAVSYWCKLDNGSLGVCRESGRSYSNLAPGPHTFTVQALDSLGLVGSRTSYTWTIDVRPPDTSITTHPDTTVNNDSVRFGFSSADGVRFVCRLDAATYRPCASPTTLTNLSDGWHVFRVAAIDRAGNHDPSPASFRFHVRTVPAVPTITSGPAAGSLTGRRPSFGFSAGYAVKFQCRFDADAFARCSGAHSHTPSSRLAGGAHTFEVRGIGSTGKPGPSMTRGIEVDAAPPKIRFREKPRIHAHRKSAVIRFRVRDASSVKRTECKRDRRRWHRCHSPVKVRHLRHGRHRLRVRATDEWGNTSRAKIRWRQPRER